MPPIDLDDSYFVTVTIQLSTIGYYLIELCEVFTTITPLHHTKAYTERVAYLSKFYYVIHPGHAYQEQGIEVQGF